MTDSHRTAPTPAPKSGAPHDAQSGLHSTLIHDWNVDPSRARARGSPRRPDRVPLADDEGRIALISGKDIRTGPRHVKWLQSIEVRKIVD